MKEGGREERKRGMQGGGTEEGRKEERRERRNKEGKRKGGERNGERREGGRKGRFCKTKPKKYLLEGSGICCSTPIEP